MRCYRLAPGVEHFWNVSRSALRVGSPGTPRLGLGEVAKQGANITRLSATRKGDSTCYKGIRTAKPTAAQAKALADIGYQGSQIAEATGLPARTVDDIINGRNGWGEITANDQALKVLHRRPLLFRHKRPSRL
jgi:hypothetical protein